MKNLYYIVSFLLLSCNSIPKNSVLIKDFPSTIVLKGDSITVFDEELGIMGLINAGDFILCSSHGTDYHYSIYKLDSLQKTGNFLKVGRGAYEFIAPDYFSQYQVEDKDTKIWILERALNKYFKINLNKTILYDSLIIDKEYNLLPFKNSSYRDIIMFKEDLLFATEDEQDCKHVFLDLSKSKKNVIPSALSFPKRYNIHEISQTISTKHPTKSFVASAFFNFPQIDLINEKGIFKTIFYKKAILPRETSLSQREDDYFNCICCDTNYIYALYNPTHDLNGNISEILTFTWQGEAIRKYIIPFSTSIFIDNNTKRLFAVNPQKESYNTSVYQLPLIKD